MIYAISDLHLSFGTDKPMDIFGEAWENHALRLQTNWCQMIKADDTILIPGDISWAMGLESAKQDFQFIHELPGHKIISKGNHDYWWSTRSKFDAFVRVNDFHTVKMLHNNAYSVNEYVICGTRGWKSIDDPSFTEEDQKIFNRELDRLKLSLSEGKKLGGEIIVMLHYPPFDMRHRPNAFSELLNEAGVKICIYGHIHGKASPSFGQEMIDGIRYSLVSADYLQFSPVIIA